MGLSKSKIVPNPTETTDFKDIESKSVYKSDNVEIKINEIKVFETKIAIKYESTVNYRNVDGGNTNLNSLSPTQFKNRDTTQPKDGNLPENGLRHQLNNVPFNKSSASRYSGATVFDSSGVVLELYEILAVIIYLL